MAWLRLETKTGTKGWTAELSTGAFKVWICLLCYAKAECRKGLVPKTDLTQTVLRGWKVQQKHLDELLGAAMAGKDPAIKEEGAKWLLVNWAKYQIDPTASERQTAFRGQKGR